MTGKGFAQRVKKLRKDMKLSQESLGGLVGLTGKAVSKWECNGTVPSMDVLMRVAQALKVDVTELVDDAEPAIPKESWDLKMHRRELWEEAEKKLRRLYGDPLPLPVANRFYKEKNALAETDAIIHFEIIREISRETEKQNKVFEAGPALYESLTAWITGASPVNPLPAHYRCPKCRRTEFHRELLSGWDLPEKTCECGSPMERDGQDLPFEVIMSGGSDPYIQEDLTVSLSFLVEAQKIILKQAGPYFSLRRYVDPAEPLPDEPIPDDPAKRPVYLPFVCVFLDAKKDGKSPDYIEDIERVEEIYNWGTSTAYAAFRIFPEPDAKRTGRKAKPRNPSMQDLLQEEVLFRALNKQNKDNAARNETIGLNFTLKNPEKYRQGLTFGKYISLLCSMESAAMTESTEALAERLNLPLPEGLPVSREDLWKMIQASSKAPGETEGIAGAIVKKLSTREYLNQERKEDQNLFQQLHLPNWFPEYAKQMFTLASRSEMTAAGITLLKEVWTRVQVER